MTPIQRRAKEIEDYYWHNKQILEVTSIEEMNGKNDYCLSIYTIKDGALDTYLFDIQTYDAMWDLERTANDGMYSKFDIVRAVCAPYYHARNNTFTLHRFGQITKADIVKATRYYCRKHLESWLIFNVRFTEPGVAELVAPKSNRIKKFFYKLVGKK